MALISNGDKVLTKNVYNSNETVLWTNSDNSETRSLTFPITLSESISNFEYVDIWYRGSGDPAFHVFRFPANENVEMNCTVTTCSPTGSVDYTFIRTAVIVFNGTTFSVTRNATKNLNASWALAGSNTDGYNCIGKIVGINRKENG